MNDRMFDAARMLLIGVFSVALLRGTSAQQPDKPGQPVIVTPNRGAPPNSKTDGKDASDGDAKSEGESAKDGKSEDPPPKVIRRDQIDGDPGDPEELRASVDPDGTVAFTFQNQSWDDLIQWLSTISDRPIDWLELPGDVVNLRSPGRYTVDQTRNLFNRHLLARGYTILEVDAGYTIVKTENINPAIVPRVAVDQLSALPEYQFVRTTLDVGWLSAEKLVEEFKPLVSSGGVLTPLKTTNQIEAMDAAVNLAAIARLVDAQGGRDSLETLAPEFQLRHLSAAEAKGMLEQFLGIGDQADKNLLSQIQSMMRSSRSSSSSKTPAKQEPPEISIVANERQNSVLIRAPADRVAVAMQFLKRIDVPSNSMTSLADIENRVEVFRLASLSPEKLIEIIGEMNVLEPSTRLRADDDGGAVIVNGSPADRYIIRSLVERLDGSGRSFEVMPLRRLDPVEVAESIAFLMGQKDDDDDQQNNRRYYSYYSRYDDDEANKEKDEFRVAANSRLNQVLLWANEQEMKQVENLLVKLGELPPPGGNRSSVRVIDASATPETLRYLQRIREQFGQIAPNAIELPEATQFVPTNPTGETDDASSTGDESESVPFIDGDRSGSDISGTSAATPDQRLAAFQSPTNDRGDGDAVDGTNGDPKNTAIRSVSDFDRAFRDALPGSSTRGDQSPDGRAGSPIQISVDADGNLVLRSDDTDALDRLETMMIQNSPPKRPYEVFHIKHASALWMKDNLEQYFSDDDGGNSDADRFFSWYWFDEVSNKDEGPSGLGKDSKLKFVYDLDTNTLVVSGATGGQLRTIRELVALWDVPEPTNKRRTRFTRLVSIQFGRAETIAETVKEAYRDLLSSNDKTFAGTRGARGGSADEDSPEKSRRGRGSSFQSDDEEGGGTDFSFKGKLSLGVDPTGNTILVSAEGESLLDLVIDMIEQLDTAARPSGNVEVLTLSGDMDAEKLKEAMKVFKQSGSSPKPNPTRPRTAR